jgi:hypothetical protein
MEENILMSILTIYDNSTPQKSHNIPKKEKRGISAFDCAQLGGFSYDESIFSKQIIEPKNPYSVGAIYQSSELEPSPASMFGGSWERLKGVFLLCSGDSYNVGDTSTGEREVTLLANHLPKHTHTFLTIHSYGSGQTWY